AISLQRATALRPCEEVAGVIGGVHGVDNTQHRLARAQQANRNGVASETVLHGLRAVVRIYQPDVGLSGGRSLEARFLAAISPCRVRGEQALADNVLGFLVRRAFTSWSSRALRACALGAQNSRRGVSSLQGYVQLRVVR